MTLLRILPLAAVLASCASASTIPLAKDTVQITARAAPACGEEGAERVALQRAAVETITRGYDHFIVANAQARDQIRVVGYGSSTIYGNTIYGGQPIYGGTHNQALIVKMFKTGDAGSQNALDARTILGADWRKKVAKPAVTCV